MAADPVHPLGCHRRRISDRIVFEKLVQALRFGCSYEAISDSGCSATTIQARRDERIAAGVFARLKQIALDAYDRIAGLVLEEILKQGMKRSLMTDGYGIPLDRVLAAASRHDSPLLPATLDKLAGLGLLPENIRVHLDAGYDSQVTRDELAARQLTGQIAHKGEKAPIQASQRWPVERASAWHNAFNRLQRCYERRKTVIDAFFDLADAIITVRSLIRQAWTAYRWEDRPARRP